MRSLIARFKPFFLYAGLFSFVLNMLMLIPAIYMMQVFNRVITSRSEATLVMLTLGVIVGLGMMSALEAVRGRLLIACGQALDRSLGPRVLDGVIAHTARLSGAEYLNGLRDVNKLRAYLTGAGIMTLFDAPWLPFFMALIFLFHPLMGAVAVTGALIMVGLAVLNERATRGPIERVSEASRDASKFIDASVRNSEVVSALGMLPAITRRWTALNEKVLREQIEASGVGGSISTLTRLTRQLIQISMVGTGAWLVVDQHVTPGVMMAGTLILARALSPVERLVATWNSMMEARIAWARLDKLLAKLDKNASVTELPAPRGELSVERVQFGLKGMERPILRQVSFSLQPGEQLGLIGPSAAGKSTLVRLVIGVWKPNSGVVRLDGADMATWPREHIGPYIGYLPQDVEIFSATVSENIARLGEVDSQAVILAARRAHVHEMILRLPEGYDTQLGDGGTALSPGQRQRIGLARALYGDPRLVVLDEPNANLDRDGEEALVLTLRELKEQGVTTLVVAHRPSLLHGVDKLLVLKDGQVEMFGGRAEIMARVTRGMQQQQQRGAA